jgi:hypothetical protein
MPAPAIPRRAAPPRRKQAPPPPPPPPPPEPEREPTTVGPATDELLADTSDTPASEATEAKDTTPAAATVALPTENDEDAPGEEEEATFEEATPPPASTTSSSPAAHTEDSPPYDVAAVKVEPPTPHLSVFVGNKPTADEQEEAEVDDELHREDLEDEHEESPGERRKRIAEKLKEMGAVNPLAGGLGEPAQIRAAAEESDERTDVDAVEPTNEKEKPQEDVSTDYHNQYAREHYDEDGSEVEYPGGSVASPTSPTRIAPVPPVLMSVPPPPPLRQAVEVEEQHEAEDHDNAAEEFAEEDGMVSTATDVEGEGEFNKGVHVLSASRQWAEDGGDEGEGKHLSPSCSMASLTTYVPVNVRLEHIPSEICDVYT